jgi:hypothetical protein
MVMKELYQLWGKDDKKYITEARKFSEQLENLLLAEHDQSNHESDSAWDSTTLREEMKELYEKMKENNTE